MRPCTICSKVLALLLLLSGVSLNAWSCTYYDSNNYYLFYVFEGSRTNRDYIQSELAQWWSSYVGTTVSVDDLEALSHESKADFAQSTNPIVRAAYQKKDKSMQAYLDLLCQYLSLAPQSDNDPWYYPDDEEVETTRRNLIKLESQAAKIKSTKYAPQLALLRLRALFQAKEWARLVQLYESTVAPMPKSIFRDMSSGFYAGALRALGKDEDAAEIYAELGDLHSATWCVHDGRNIGTLRRLYQTNPNSQVVRLLLQDFVNNTQETTDELFHTDYTLGHDGYLSKVTMGEVNEFIALAEQAAANPQVQDTKMWLTAAAWTAFLYKQTANAQALIQRALTARGEEISQRTARTINIAMRIETERDTKTLEAFLLPELKWLTSQAAQAGQDYSPAYYATQRILIRHLSERMTKENRPLDAALYLSLASRIRENNYEAEEVSPRYVDYSSDYVDELIQLDADALKEVYAQLFEQPHTNLRSYLIEQLAPELKKKDFYNDLIGTALMREARFEEALPYLERVSLDFLSQQLLSYYMARRDYSLERWMGPRQTLPEVKDGYGGEVPTKLTSNQRANFCRHIIELKGALKDAATTEQAADVHYMLATLLYQATQLGDCWYLTAYGRSTYVEEVDTLYKLVNTHLAEGLKLAQKAKYDELTDEFLFAKAYCEAQGQSFYTYEYDIDSERYTLEFDMDKISLYGKDFTALTDHVWQMPVDKRPDYVTNCDVVTTFIARFGGNK